MEECVAGWWGGRRARTRMGEGERESESESKSKRESAHARRRESGTFLVIISSNTFSAPQSFYSPGTPMTCTLDLLL